MAEPSDAEVTGPVSPGIETAVYIDASALAKLYVPEAESERLDTFLRGRLGLMISELAITEQLSAVARSKREGELRPELAHQIRGALLADADSRSFARLHLARSPLREPLAASVSAHRRSGTDSGTGRAACAAAHTAPMSPARSPSWLGAMVMGREKRAGRALRTRSYSSGRTPMLPPNTMRSRSRSDCSVTTARATQRAVVSRTDAASSSPCSRSLKMSRTVTATVPPWRRYRSTMAREPT